MKPRFSSTAAWKTAVVVLAVVVAVSAVGSVQAATPQNQISVRDQDLNTGIAVLDSVTAAQGGWVIVYSDPSFTDGSIVGYAPVNQGVNSNVKVTIDTGKLYSMVNNTRVLQPTLWVRLHVDNPVMGLLEWGGLHNFPYNDSPVIENGHEVTAEFGTWASQAASPVPAAPVATPAPSQPVAPVAPVTAKPKGNTGPIVVQNQDLNSGVIVIDSVTAPQDGWVVVYDYPDLTDGHIVGYAPVMQGVNQNVKVTIDTGKVGDLPSLWVRLHVDNEVKGLFEWGGLHNLPYNDPPVIENGHEVVAEFGTWSGQ